MDQLNIQNIQAVLWEEIQKIREGTTTAANCNAITNATGKILSAVKLHVEYCKITGKAPDIEMFMIDDPKSKIQRLK